MISRAARFTNRVNNAVKRRLGLSKLKPNAIRGYDFAKDLDTIGWYHSIKLPDGVVIKGYISLEDLEARYADFDLPGDLKGVRALDVGAWDGWFSFELEKHGADVVAVDVMDLKTFRHAHSLIGSRVRYETATVYDLPKLELGMFDLVLFLGVLYHLRHPLLALERLCGMCSDKILIEFFRHQFIRQSAAAFFPALDGVLSGGRVGQPTRQLVWADDECLLAMVRAAGFVRPTLVNIRHDHAQVVAYRKWEDEPRSPSVEPLRLEEVKHYLDNGVAFRSGVEDFVCFRFSTSGHAIAASELCFEIGGYGAHAASLKRLGPSSWQAHCMLPPGLSPGWHDARLRTQRSRFANSFKVSVDVAP